MFLQVRDILHCEGADAAVKVKFACAWKSLRELNNLLRNQSIQRTDKPNEKCVKDWFCYK